MLNLPHPADRPTMYFIGVTTTQSSIMKLFPLWAEVIGLKDACIKGIDISIHAPAEDYRKCVEFIKNDPLSVGALVTTHKIDLYNAAKDLFEEMDSYALKFGELSSISKKDGRLIGHAKDPITAGMSLDAFIPKDYWLGNAAEVVILGAGGSALSISAYLSAEKFGENVPKRIHMTNRSAPRLSEAIRILADSRVPLSFHLNPQPEWNDRIVNQVPAGSLIINATGLGKDRPGSPLTSQVNWPKHGLVWELNYRGTLEFMHDAVRHQEDDHLTIEDGWIYFIHGWTEVIAEVFHVRIDGEIFDECSRLAMQNRT